MSIKAGLVGLPNVGKSTLFNALTKSSVPAENYPFCTIDPHVAITHVPDERMDELQKLYESKKQIPASMSFVDIAGLVKGASQGAGLGNQFLGHIKEVDLILHVLRCFEDSNVTNTQNTVNPIDDYEIIMTELVLKDLESVIKRKQKVEHSQKAARSKPQELKELSEELVLLNDIERALNENNIQRVFQLAHRSVFQSARELLCAKGSLYIANVGEEELANKAYEQNKHVQSLYQRFGKDRVVVVSAKIEGELALLDPAAAQELMSSLGIEHKGLYDVIKAAYRNLNMITFFTCGPQEIHAWPIRNGITVRTAAGEIHSDLERGFICAEVLNYNDLVTCKSLASARQAGKIRTEGQQYLVTDGDIIIVKFNV